MRIADVKNLVTRRAVWILAGVVVYAVLGLFAADARAACPDSSLYTQSLPASQAFATRQAAYEFCIANLPAKYLTSTNYYTDGIGCKANEAARTYNMEFQAHQRKVSGICSANTTILLGSPGYTWPAQACPTGSVWDEASKKCSAPCSVEDPPLTGGWLQERVGTPNIETCVNNCAYFNDTGEQVSKKIDGITYFSVKGWVALGNSCTAGAWDSATPPPDDDGDGFSDGNDRNPGNPGESGPNPPPPTCGAAGQPACPPGSGNGNTSTGGGNCQTPPNSAGDPILANIAYQTWATRCASERTADAAEGKGSGGGIVVAGGSGGTKPGTSTGGGNCSTPPQSTGDGILAQIATQSWTARCKLEKLLAGDGEGNGLTDAPDMPWVEGQGGSGDEWSSGMGSSGSCPAPVSVPLSLAGWSGSIEFKFQPICDFASAMRGLVIAMGLLSAAYIVAGVRR